MKKLAAISLALVALTACGLRSVEREIVDIDGRTFLCTHTQNNLSGNESDGRCIEVTP